MTTLYNPTPGQVLQSLWLEPLNITISQFAEDAHLSTEEVQGIVDGKNPITKEISQKINAYIKAQFDWVGMRKDYEFFEIMNRHKKIIVKTIREIEKKLRTHSHFKIQSPVGLHLSNDEFIRETEHTLRLFNQIIKVLEKRQKVEYIEPKNTLDTMLTELKQSYAHTASSV